MIEVINGLPDPPTPALVEFAKAADGLEPCLVAAQSPNIEFVQNILCLEIKSLDCLSERLQEVAVLAGTGVSEFSTSQVKTILGSYAAIVGILNLAGELFAGAGLNLPVAPVLGAGTDPASLRADLSTIATFTTTLRSVADALGGC